MQECQIEAIVVIIKPGFDIAVFCREAMAEHTAHGAGLRNRRTESIVSVLRDGVAISIKVTNDVTDIVVVGNEWHAVNGEV